MKKQLSLFDYNPNIKPPVQGKLFDHRNEPSEVKDKPPWKLGSFEGRIEVYAIEDYYVFFGNRELTTSKPFVAGKNVEELNAPITHQPLYFDERRFGLRFIDSEESKDYKNTSSLAQAIKKIDYQRYGIRWRHPFGQDKLLEKSRGQIVAKWTPRKDHVRVKCYLTIDEILEIESKLV